MEAGPAGEEAASQSWLLTHPGSAGRPPHPKELALRELRALGDHNPQPNTEYGTSRVERDTLLGPLNQSPSPAGQGSTAGSGAPQEADVRTWRV